MGMLDAFDGKRGRQYGMAIATVSVLCVSPDAALLQWLLKESSTRWNGAPVMFLGEGVWQVLFFKLLLMGVLNGLFALAYMEWDVRSLWQGMVADPPALLVASLLQVAECAIATQPDAPKTLCLPLCRAEALCLSSALGLLSIYVSLSCGAAS